MNQTNQHDPLLEWNRLNKENAEHGFASALYKSLAHTSPIVDKFSLWLLAGTGATGALLVSQIQTILPHLSEGGFKICLTILVLSAIFGFIAKYKNLRCQIQDEIDNKLKELTSDVLAKHEEDEAKIQNFAEQRGIELETEIEFSRIVEIFSEPFPLWVKWLVNRQAKKNSGNRQAGYHIAIKAYISQIRYTFFQSIAFLAFLCAAVWYAKAI